MVEELGGVFGEITTVHVGNHYRVKEIDKVIDGCFLSCLGRAMKILINEKKLIHVISSKWHCSWSDQTTNHPHFRHHQTDQTGF